MPNPRPGEDKQAYVARFMASSEAQKDFPDEKQRAAVAYSMWGEKKNALMCRDCGGVTEASHGGGRACIECGYHDRDATPPVESIPNICRTCRHPLDPEHSDYGCNLDGCSCTQGQNAIVVPEDVLPNAGDVNDLNPQMAQMWDGASDAEKRRTLEQAGLGIGLMQMRWSQMTPAIRAEIAKKVFDVENKNIRDDAFLAKKDAIIAAEKEIRSKLRALRGKEGTPEFQDLERKLRDNEKEYDRLHRENKNADDKGPFDQPNPMGCNGCDDSRAPLNKEGYCARCAKEQGPRQNAGPRAAFEAHAAKCEGCNAVYNADKMAAEKLCSDGLAIMNGKAEDVEQIKKLVEGIEHEAAEIEAENAGDDACHRCQHPKADHKGGMNDCAAEGCSCKLWIPNSLGNAADSPFEREAAGAAAYGSRA